MVNGVFSFKYDAVLRYLQDLLDQGGRQGPGTRYNPGPLMQTQGQAEGGGQMDLCLFTGIAVIFSFVIKSHTSIPSRLRTFLRRR